MTQILLNTLNNLQDMMSKKTSSSFEKDFSSKKCKTDIFEKQAGKISRMDKTSTQKATDFDKVFNKQLEKNSPSTIGDVKTEAKNNIKTEIKNGISTNTDTDNTETSNVLDSVGKLIDYKNDWSKSLSELREFISKVTDEANTENSLDLTLARDINEIINQLKSVSEETAEAIESTTEDACTAIIDELISNVEAQEDVEENPENLEGEINIEDTSSNNKDSNLAYEQLMAYVNKVELPKVEEQEDLKNINTLELETEEVQLNSEIIDLTSEIITNNETTKTTVKSTTDDVEIPLDEDSLKELNIESIKAESYSSDNEGGSSLMEHQSPEEHSVKAMLNQDLENFDLKIEKTFETQNIQQPQAKPIEVTPSKIIEQITKQMESLQNNSKVNIVLNPESLGKVTIQLLKTGEGLSAQFTVGSQEVKDMLMKGLEGLKDTLMAQGVGVDNVTIKLNESQKSSYNPDWTEQEGSRGGNKEQERSNKDEKQKNIFEQMMAQTEDENGNV